MDKLRELSDSDIAVECQILDQLRATNDADAAALRQAMAAQDTALVARSTHRMAGANMMIAAAAFAGACSTIADADRNKGAAAVAAALALFDAEQVCLNACLDQADAALQPALPQATETALPQAASLSFLIVDDHAFQRHSMRMLLSQLGASRIAEAADGQAALRLPAMVSQPGCRRQGTRRGNLDLMPGRSLSLYRRGAVTAGSSTRLPVVGAALFQRIFTSLLQKSCPVPLGNATCWRQPAALLLDAGDSRHRPSRNSYMPCPLV